MPIVIFLSASSASALRVLGAKLFPGSDLVAGRPLAVQLRFRRPRPRSRSESRPVAQPRPVDLADLRPRLERAFDCAVEKVRKTVEQYPDYFPIYTRDGRWKHEGE